jgi:hypothetical protein
MNGKIRTLQQFYALMEGTRAPRAAMVRRLLEDSSPAAIPDRRLPAADVDSLAAALEALQTIPEEADGRRRRLGVERGGSGKEVPVLLDLSYEIGELEKDLFFLRHTEEDFLAYLAGLHPGFAQELEAGVSFLKDLPRVNFFTDRDGTVNNYCGRYRSSIQSAWNGLFLARFARGRTRHAVLLTSAPLDGGGLLDVSVMPRELFHWAGSKGRELLDRRGRRRRLPIEEEKQRRLEALNRSLEELVGRPEFEVFSLIGSGLQRKFGQTTIARQDIHRSVPEPDSRRFLERVAGLVSRLDPQGAFFRIEDTGTDIEIVLTVGEKDGGGPARPPAPLEGSGTGEGGGGPPREFDKGDGIVFIARELALDLERGPNLIGGDTASDVAMVRAAAGARAEAEGFRQAEPERYRTDVRRAPGRRLRPRRGLRLGVGAAMDGEAAAGRTPENWAVFVTRREELRRVVAAACPRAFFVGEPDTLVAMLNRLGKEELRPDGGR